MFKKHDAEITGVAKVSQNEVCGVGWVEEGRTSIVNAAINKAVDREYLVICQSCNSISRRMRSRTSRRPPPSFLTRRGLRVSTSSKLSSFPRLEPGLVGTSLSPDACAEAGISSHSCPSISKGLRKDGHRLVRIERDSRASAPDIGTGDDFKTAAATSEAGRVRRLRTESPMLVVDGPEKSIQTLSATPSNRPNRTRRRISS